MFNSWMLSNSWLLHRLYQSSNEALEVHSTTCYVVKSCSSQNPIPSDSLTVCYDDVWPALQTLYCIVITYVVCICILLTSGSLYWCIVLGSKKSSIQKCLYLKCVELYVMAWTPLKSLIFNTSMSKFLLSWLNWINYPCHPIRTKFLLTKPSKRVYFDTAFGF